MKHPLLAILPVALLASACAQTPPVTTRTGEGMVDPKTQALDPKYVDDSFSLADLYEQRLNRRLPNSDRRAIDEAMRRALGEPPANAASAWINPVTKTSGEVDLVRWQVDRRFGELCGSFEHSARLPDATGGAFIICRASNDPGWVLDESVWRGGPVAAATPRKPATPTLPAKPRPAPIAETRPPYNPPVASPPSNAGVRPRNFTPPPCPTGSGAQTLGDCLAAPN